ncbi:hypothetical protein F4820DRAFT_438279 [Hypoxylon rubiginosum]|uniref:Uncharacterized protein n=1 Tax=Hypoxylon rubiginosum TaxID=110542 RepID=A0ACB9YKN9_9PEZI|nr:hypothetical protein F4820DRAFT_438279 [Hypoxylon rubiginosum]
MEKARLLPRPNGHHTRKSKIGFSWKSIVLATVLATLLLAWLRGVHPGPRPTLTATQLSDGLRQCANNHQHPFVDYSLASTRLSIRDSKSPVKVFRNATLIDGDGSIHHEVDIEIQGDIITYVGKPRAETSTEAVIVGVGGRYLSPGLVDMHSHVGIRQEPQILMNADVTESTLPVTPWARAIDGFKPSDAAIKIVASGGTTTSLVLAGASNLISGEGMVIKHRDTNSVWEMEIDSTSGGTSPKRQRYLKMACGENIKQIFEKIPGGPISRLGESGYVRFAFEEARNLLQGQDAWCERAAVAGGVGLDTPYPTSLHWQTLVDTLRGDVSVHLHCYQTQDVFSQFDHADEFGYNITALHHITQAHEMLDEIKNRGSMLATFSDEGGFKNENYHASWYMLKLAAEAGIPIALTTDHPAKHGQFFAQEAQIGHHFQLEEKLAISSITSVPARALGLDNRIGWVRPGYDADLVVWDSHPLALGATPLQVVVDGKTYINASQNLWEESVKRKQAFAPAPPSRSQKVNDNKTCSPGQKDIVLRGVIKSYINGLRTSALSNTTAVVRGGVLQCVGDSICEAIASEAIDKGVPELHLKAGYILPGIVSATRSHGLSELVSEPSTKDGELSGADVSRVISAADGLRFGDRRLAITHRRGLTTLITAPISNGFIHGLSTAFRPGAAHSLSPGAIVKRDVSLFLSIGHEGKNTAFPSESSQFNELRTLLTSQSPPHESWALAANGTLPITVRTDSKDVIAKLIALKRELPALRVVIHGGGEAHLLARELAAARVAVVLAPFRCSRLTWETRSCPPGPPLTDAAGPDVLLAAGVKLGIGIWDHRDRWATNALWEASWLARGLPAGRRGEVAVDLVARNMREMYGLEVRDEREFVVYEGDPLEYGASVALIVEEGEVQRCWPDVEEEYVY